MITVLLDPSHDSIVACVCCVLVSVLPGVVVHDVACGVLAPVLPRVVVHNIAHGVLAGLFES